MNISALLIQLNNLFEAGIAVWFMTQYFSQEQAKTDIWKPLLTGAILYIWLHVSVSLSVNDLFITAVCFCVLFAYSNFCLPGSTIQHCILALVCQLLLPVVSICYIQVSALLAHLSVMEFINIDNPSYFLGMVITKAIYALLLQAILMVCRKNKLSLPKLYAVAVGGVFMCMIVTEGTLFYVIEYGGLEKRFVSGIIGIFISIFGILIFQFYSIYKISQWSAQEEERKILKMQNEYQEKYIKEMQWAEKQLTRIRHDYKNHVGSMLHMLENGKPDELKSYLESVGAYYLNNTAEYINTENSVLDAVLNIKFAVCREEGIKSSCIWVGSFRQVEAFCLGTILCNLLDNAIEACKKEAEKELILEMKMDADYMNILVKNKIRTSVLKDNPNLYTTKSEKHMHGIGMQHVKELVRNQKGMYDRFEEEGFFCIHIMIPTSQLTSVA